MLPRCFVWHGCEVKVVQGVSLKCFHPSFSVDTALLKDITTGRMEEKSLPESRKKRLTRPSKASG